VLLVLDLPEQVTVPTVSREKTKQEPVGNGTDLLEVVVRLGGCVMTTPLFTTFAFYELPPAGA